MSARNGPTPEPPERLSGTIERVQQSDRERHVLLRLTAPAPGIALIGTNDDDNATNASMALYLYGDDAEQRALSSESKWRDWFNETFKQSAH